MSNNFTNVARAEAFRFVRGKKHFASIDEEKFLHVLAMREPDSLEAATLFHVFCLVLKASENFTSSNLIIVVVENRLYQRKFQPLKKRPISTSYVLRIFFHDRPANVYLRMALREQVLTRRSWDEKKAKLYIEWNLKVFGWARELWQLFFCCWVQFLNLLRPWPN